MEHHPVHAHALQQDLSVQAVELLPGKAKTVYLCTLYISQRMAVYGQHLTKSFNIHCVRDQPCNMLVATCI